MDPEKGGGRPSDFLSSLKASVRQTMQQGRAKLEQTYSKAEQMRTSVSNSFEQTKQQGQAFASSLMEQGQQKFEQTRAMIPALQKAPIVASQQLDKGAQQIGSMATDTAREWALLKPHPDDGFVWGLQKKGINFGINTASRYTKEMLGFVKDFSSGVGSKVGGNFIDNYSPMNAVMAATHPELAQQYVKQRKDRLLTIYRAYMDPSIIQKEMVPAIKNGVLNYHHLYSQLDGHGMTSVYHGGRAVKDWMQDKGADVLGTGLGMYAAFNATSGMREKNKQTAAKIFPKGTPVGMLGRFPGTLLTKPLIYAVANPRMMALMAAYGFVANMGKNMLDQQALKQEAPDTGSRTKLIDSSSQLTKVRAVSGTSHKSKL
jgi:hypothetical protein